MSMTKEQVEAQLLRMAEAGQAGRMLSGRIVCEKMQQALLSLLQRHDELFHDFKETFRLFGTEINDPALQRRLSDLLSSGYRNIFSLIEAIQAQQGSRMTELSLVCEELKAAWSINTVSPMASRESVSIEQRQRQWAFDGISCDYVVSEDQGSYYEIKATILKLSNRQILEPIQKRLEILDKECSVKNKTVRNKAGRISIVYLKKEDEEELEALRETIVQLEALSARGASLSFFHQPETHIERAEQVDINNAYTGGIHNHHHEAFIPGLMPEAKRLGKQIQEDPQTVYQTWGLIPRKNPDFTGRKDLLRRLLRVFAVRDHVVNQVSATSFV